MRSAYAHCADPGDAEGQIRPMVNMFLSADRRPAVERMRFTS